MNISGLTKAAVLAALYNAAQPQGMGFMQYDPMPMTEAEAFDLLKRTVHFDYLKGRVLKLSFDEDEIDTRYYDRDNGVGAAQRAIDSLRSTGNVNAPDIAATHAKNTKQQFAALRR